MLNRGHVAAATLLLWAAAACAGCHAVAKFNATEGATRDSSVDGDISLADLTFDADLNVDVDATVDLRAVTDLPPPDVPAVDATDDGPPPPPCAAFPSTLAVAQTYSPTMVVCADSAPSGKLAMDQCKAEAVCNRAGGWYLCTATDFLSKGGTGKGVLIDAWIGACVRDGGNPTPPVDGRCTTCTPVATTTKAVEFGCGGGNGKPSFGDRVGVTTHAGCSRVGINNSAYNAFWSTAEANTKLSAAVCCR